MTNATKKITKNSSQSHELTPEIIRRKAKKSAQNKTTALAYLKSIGLEVQNGKVKVTPL